MPQTSSSEKLTRTSVFLPNPVLEQLRALTPKQSEGIRLALERYLYIRESALTWTEHIVEEHGELLVAALADFDETDFKTITRVLPELVESYASELSEYDPLTRHSQKAVEQLRQLNAPSRIAVLDWAVAWRRNGLDAGDIITPRT